MLRMEPKQTALPTRMIAIGELRADPKNPRTITPEALDRLVQSIRTYGFTQPVVFNRRTGYLVAGHQRVIAAARLGMTEVPAVIVDYDEATQRAANVSLNAGFAEFDSVLLRDLILELDAQEYDLDTVALQTGQIDDIVQSVGSLVLPPSVEDALSEGNLAVRPTDPEPAPAPPTPVPDTAPEQPTPQAKGKGRHPKAKAPKGAVPGKIAPETLSGERYGLGRHTIDVSGVDLITIDVGITSVTVQKGADDAADMLLEASYASAQ
jgi:ParB/RepB/Spo0J family partition protein